MLIWWCGGERHVWNVWASRRDGRQQWLLDYLAERKSWSDLVGSIKSARYRQQKGAMMATGLRHLLYIVEGHEQCLTSALPLHLSMLHHCTSCMKLQCQVSQFQIF